MEHSGFQTPLPPCGVPSFISEILAAESDGLDGKSVRIVGRVIHYDAGTNRAVVSDPNLSNKTSTCRGVNVDGQLVDACDLRPGSLVMLIGELRAEEVSPADESGCSNQTSNADINSNEKTMNEISVNDEIDIDREDELRPEKRRKLEKKVVLIPRVSQCVDRLDYSQYCAAVKVLRDFSSTRKLDS